MNETGQVAQTQGAVTSPSTTTVSDPVPGTKPTKKVFSKAKVVRSVEVGVTLPKLYPDFEPWVFKLGLKLSKDAESRRQSYLSLSASDQQVKLEEQALDEICDLLLESPTGFEDLQHIAGPSAGPQFRQYVESTTDIEAKKTLLAIVDGASTLYWRTILPQEFRK